jgi:hypothetical protein
LVEKILLVGMRDAHDSGSVSLFGSRRSRKLASAFSDVAHFNDASVGSFVSLARISERAMLLPNRLTFMQRVQDCARLGYSNYFLGQIAADKWGALEWKLAGAYETELAKATRSKRRKRGEAVTLVYAYRMPRFHKAEDLIRWVMVSTDGRGRIHGREALSRFDRARLTIDGYELVHDGVGWSWQMTRERFEYWRDRIHMIASRDRDHRKSASDSKGEFDVEIEAAMDVLYRQPGFRLVRRQIGRLVAFARHEWRRLRPEVGVQIRTRSFLPYVQRLPNNPGNSKRRSKNGVVAKPGPEIERHPTQTPPAIIDVPPDLFGFLK